ncbi:Sorcin, partial [Acipenser ruthenus]
YGGAPGAPGYAGFAGQAQDPLYPYFSAVAGQRDCSCKMGFNEFKELWAVLSAWKQHFMTMDKDRSGTVDPEEMRQSIASMGYHINPSALVVILKRFSTHGMIAFDDYVACCIKLRTLTGTFFIFVFSLTFLPTLI